MNLWTRIKETRKNRRRSPPLVEVSIGEEAELAVARGLRRSLRGTGDTFYAGLRIPDAEAGHKRELDFVITRPDEVIIIELKYWIGTLELSPKGHLIQRRPQKASLDHGPLFKEMKAREQALRALIKSHKLRPLPIRSLLIFYKPGLKIAEGFGKLRSQMMEWRTLRKQLSCARPRLAVQLLRLLRRWLGGASSEAPSKGILALREALDLLGSWDEIELYGGRRFMGDLRPQRGCNPLVAQIRLVDREQLAGFEVEADRCYLKALLFTPQLRVRLDFRGGEELEGDLPLERQCLIHSVGARRPHRQALREIKHIRYGYRQLESGRLSWDKLEEGARFQGRIKAVKEFGLFVDFGAPVDGLIHISQIDPERYIEKEEVLERFSSGQLVEVELISRDPAAQRLGLRLLAKSGR